MNMLSLQWSVCYLQAKFYSIEISNIKSNEKNWKHKSAKQKPSWKDYEKNKNFPLNDTKQKKKKVKQEKIPASQ